MTDLKVREAGGRIPYREGKGDKYKVRMMGWEPGAEFAEGSSALYPVEAIKRDFPTAFPEGTRMRANHDGFCEAGGDIRRVMGRTTETPWAEEDGMYTNIQISEQWNDTVREYGDVIGLSVSVAAEPFQDEDEDGDLVTRRDAESGLPIIKRFFTQEESPYNSLDFVEAPGADGRIVLAIESVKNHLEHMNVREAAKFASGILARESKDSSAVPPRNIKEEKPMLEAKDIAAITEALAPVLTEALRPQETPKEVKGTDVAEAAFEAGLSEDGRRAVYESVAGGADYSEVIARESRREKALIEATEKRVRDEFAAEPGYTTFESDSPAGSTDIDESFEALFEGREF